MVRVKVLERAVVLRIGDHGLHGLDGPEGALGAGPFSEARLFLAVSRRQSATDHAALRSPRFDPAQPWSPTGAGWFPSL